MATGKPYGIWAELRIIRERTGLTTTELARRADVGKGHVSDLETGRRWPTPAVTKKLADALKVPYTVLQRTDEEVAS